MLICVLGDATLDVSVAPLAPIVPGADQRAPVTLGPGGQGANVAVRLARRGQRVRLLAPIADDAAGALVRRYLEDEGVELAALPAERTALVVAVISPDGERAMLSDRAPLGGDLASRLQGTGWVHCSGYALRDPAEADLLVATVRASGLPVSVAGGSFESGADAATARGAIGSLRPRLLVLGRDEASRLAGESGLSAAGAATRLGSRATLAVVTDAAGGSAACGGPIEAPLMTAARGAANADASAGATGDATAAGNTAGAGDATGAGDAFAAVLLAELAPGWPPQRAALEGALRLASQVGAAVAHVPGAQGRIAGERTGRGLVARSGE